MVEAAPAAATPDAMLCPPCVCVETSTLALPWVSVVIVASASSEPSVMVVMEMVGLLNTSTSKVAGPDRSPLSAGPTSSAVPSTARSIAPGELSNVMVIIRSQPVTTSVIERTDAPFRSAESVPIAVSIAPTLASQARSPVTEPSPLTLGLSSLILN